MKPKEIQEILEFIATSGLEEVNIEMENVKITTKKSYQPTAVVAAAPQVLAAPVAAVQAPIIAPTPVSAAETAKQTAEAAQTVSEAGYKTIKSPMIGTFYRSPGPNEDLFVNVGDSVSKGTTVCIIEAMKLFNEIESEFAGKIVKILVNDATPVEYDQPLFLVDPS
ncbi:MAG: acetyl-CoA carboxylase biotin carboxyl carrier protein [Bacteroidetes bacterium]|nr:MAG: acetyl-CoA carboxylase biotin carboxyl carrier protein [Bacteroidota bacterium]